MSSPETTEHAPGEASGSPRSHVSPRNVDLGTHNCREVARLARVSLELNWSRFSAQKLLLPHNGEGIVFANGLKERVVVVYHVESTLLSSNAGVVCGALNAAVRQHSRSASVTTFYVWSLAELPVMLRPAFEEYKLLFVSLAVDVTSQYRLLTRWSLVLLWEPLFLELCVGDAGNTSLVDAGTPLGATAVVTSRGAGYLLWECCILASRGVVWPYQGPVPHSWRLYGEPSAQCNDVTLGTTKVCSGGL